ncbi:30S ribosomal protein S16 [Candidatus Wolfebacteria bacterium]|nr:30S ribosomal protein S16 [Candidatus Wolfebacteria bacterium]
MLAIKFRRIGRKHQPAFRIVVAEKRSKLRGRFVEDLGWMNPLLHKFEVKKDRAAHWLTIGAQPTASVHNLFVRAGVVSGPKKAVHKINKQSTTKN